ncbi:Com family DNA-binding transcriptional regulator [Shinella sp.]|uniref:Com family DNA-binding transcriptional regulator n=1 Tax=Shinella sp. TaxID=1870904 RepID=UPI00338FF021|nr:Com family DNA-binding transcriptional regulator [Shinella sp.]
MQNIRCGSCRALLFRARHAAISNDIEIKCRRCGTLNHLRPIEPAPDRPERPTSERSIDREQRRSSSSAGGRAGCAILPLP